MLRTFLLSVLIVSVQCHSRWKCPPPRDANDENGNHIEFKNTANKDGPCGLNSGMIYGYNGITPLSPGPQTFVWEESITHKGAPYRINLLTENGDIKATILDHIPHDDSVKTTMNEKNYTPYKMTIEIPNVKCEKCSLQLLFLMTDKTVKCGTEYCNYYENDDNCIGHVDEKEGICAGAVPSSGPCKHKDTCFSVYHSCVDISIDGTVAMKDFEGGDIQRADWPYNQNSNKNYTLENAKWSNSWLSGVPDFYTTDTGKNLCE